MTARIYYPEIIVRTDHETEINRARKAGRRVEEVDAGPPERENSEQGCVAQ